MIKPLVLSDTKQNDSYTLLDFIDYVIRQVDEIHDGHLFIEDMQKAREATEELKRREAIRKVGK